MTERTQPQVTLTVGQVAGQFDITVRTLHHYDQIGLLSPSERSAAGYRLYTEDDLTRLQHAVVYRRLGFALEEIHLLLDHPESVEQHLRRQRAAVTNRLDEMRDLVAAIDRALEKERSGMRLTRQEQQELFGEGYSDEYAAEAFAEAKRAGLPADSPQAMDAAEQHRLLIHRRFYDLDHDFHRNLADMYVADPRFTKTYEDQEPGLAQYVRDAIHANADRHAE